MTLELIQIRLWFPSVLSSSRWSLTFWGSGTSNGPRNNDGLWSKVQERAGIVDGTFFWIEFEIIGNSTYFRILCKYNSVAPPEICGRQSSPDWLRQTPGSKTLHGLPEMRRFSPIVFSSARASKIMDRVSRAGPNILPWNSLQLLQFVSKWPTVEDIRCTTPVHSISTVSDFALTPELISNSW
jgi:hypothetical protein